LFASVTLTRDLPESGREAGEGGAVVEIYEDGAAYEVEFFDGAGETIALVLVPAEALRLTTDADRAARGPGRVAAE
jgi:hypothetical protein